MCRKSSCWWEIEMEKSFYFCAQFTGIILAMEGTASFCYSTDLLIFFKFSHSGKGEGKQHGVFGLFMCPCSWTASFGFSARKGITMGSNWESALRSTGKHWSPLLLDHVILTVLPNCRNWGSCSVDRKWNDSTRELLTAHSPFCLPLTEFAST